MKVKRRKKQKPRGREREGKKKFLEREMPPSIAAGFWILSALILQAAVVVSGFPAALTLERAFPRTIHEGGLGLSQLRERDRVRHRRFLQSSSSGVVDFPVEGTYDPFLVG